MEKKKTEAEALAEKLLAAKYGERTVTEEERAQAVRFVKRFLLLLNDTE